jgi:hypothetical protein
MLRNDQWVAPAGVSSSIRRRASSPGSRRSDT